MKKLFLLACFMLLTGCSYTKYLKPHPRPWTKGEKIAVGYFLVAHVANCYSTERHQDYPDLFYERNPVLGNHPNDGEIVGYFAISGVLALVVSHWWPELRYPLLLGYGSANTYFAYDDIRLIKRYR